MSRYVINILASRDLTAIADYFAETNMEVGEQFFREFNSKCQQLISFPSSGKSYAAIRADLRGLSIEGYIIFYRILDDGIEILRVVSGRRNLLTNDSHNHLQLEAHSESQHLNPVSTSFCQFHRRQTSSGIG
jgi:toxin ParE1/3/4